MTDGVRHEAHGRTGVSGRDGGVHRVSAQDRLGLPLRPPAVAHDRTAAGQHPADLRRKTPSQVNSARRWADGGAMGRALGAGMGSAPYLASGVLERTAPTTSRMAWLEIPASALSSVSEVWVAFCMTR